MIRILVADVNAIDREALILLLQTQREFEIVGAAATAEQARNQCRERGPDLLILDTLLLEPGGNGAIAAVHEVSARTRILALAGRSAGHCLLLNPPRPARLPTTDHRSHCDPEIDCLQLAVSLGASGAIRRSATPAELFDAVRAVAGGEPWYEPRVAQRILERDAEAAGDRSHVLSERDLQVAALVGDGCSNKEISRSLGISGSVVKRHVGHILHKLGLQDRLQLGLYVARNPSVLAGHFCERGSARTSQADRIPR